MSPLRLFVLTAAVAALAAPLGSLAAPGGDTGAACAVKKMTLTERRISEEAAKGLPALIGFVNLTQPIYQVRLVDAVAWLDAERERRNECISASAGAVSD
ncbi:MAG TPA: hypothetical protein VGO85_20650 [Caldimonas sp.]|jgi:hypothetical protein|nr:hypothetical protein [Caldimonas sp.]